MDSDAYTCGTCKHGWPYEAGCDICEAIYEAMKKRTDTAIKVKAAPKPGEDNERP